MLAFFYGTRELLWTGIAGSIFGETGAIRDTLRRCEQLVRDRLGWSIEEACSSRKFDEPQFRGPVLIAIQLALTEGWREQGVEPDVIAARSGGEIAGEYARGALSLEDAMEIACRIARLVQEGRGQGSMLLLSLGFDEAEQFSRSSPVPFFTISDVLENTTMVACETAALGRLKQLLEARRIGYRVVEWGMAPHCPLIDDWKLDLLKPLSGKSSDELPLPYYSAATTERDDGTSAYPTRLWRAVREPCLTIRMLDRLIADGCTIFLEIGTWPLLAPLVQRRAAALGKRIITLPARQIEPFPAIARVSGRTVATMSVRQLEPLPELMAKTERYLRQLGVSSRPRRAAV